MRIIDNLSELVYVAELSSHNLLYVNKTCRDKFQLKEWKGKKCCQLLQGRDGPCPFCSINQLEKRKELWGQFFNPVVKGYCQLRDTLMDWRGHPAKLEIANDINGLADLLSDTHFKILKIDMHIISNLQGFRPGDNGKEDQHTRTYILRKHLTDLCRKFGIYTVAEGVETQEQLEALQHTECDAAQGYLFSRPISSEELYKEVFDELGKRTEHTQEGIE